jgi:hypothetical protein
MKQAYSYIIIFFFFFILLQPNYSIAQQNKTDTVQSNNSLLNDSIVDIEKVHNPKKATLYSAILPGLGQAYNEKYWKIPVIYAGLATTGYFMYVNNVEYKRYKDAYKIRMDDDPNSIDEFDGKYNDQSLKNIRDYYRRNFELMIVATAAIYALNIIDATVDGHLKDFEVNDDISLRFDVGLFHSAYCSTPSLQIKINLK